MIEARPSRHVVLKYSSSNSPPPTLATADSTSTGVMPTTRTRKKRTSMDTQVLEDQAVIISSKRTTRSSTTNSMVPTEDEDNHIEEKEEEVEKLEEDEPSPSERIQDNVTSEPASQYMPKPVGRPPKSRNAATGINNNSTSSPAITGATRGRKPGARRGRKPKDHSATPVSEKLDPFKNLHQNINNHYKEHLAAQESLKQIFASAPETLADINLLYDLTLDAESEWNQTVDKLNQVLVDMKDKWMMLEYKRRKIVGDIQIQKTLAAKAAADDEEEEEIFTEPVEANPADADVAKADASEVTGKEVKVAHVSEEDPDKHEEIKRSMKTEDNEENTTESKDVSATEQEVGGQESEPALKKRKL